MTATLWLCLVFATGDTCKFQEKLIAGTLPPQGNIEKSIKSREANKKAIAVKEKGRESLGE